MTNGVFTLNLDEAFPRLSRPPIVEAVIHWQARPTIKLTPETLQTELLRRFPRFPKCSPIHAMEASAKVSSWGDTTAVQQQRLLGFRLVSETDREVVQVLREGVTYSVVREYSHWDLFRAAAVDVWSEFSDLTVPNELQRVGVRFINHFPTVTASTLEQILREPPSCPASLPLAEFVYQSRFDVPSYEYGVRAIKVLQPTTQGMPESSGLFLDLDAFTTKAIQNNPADIETALQQLRWLKNKVFFSLLTESAIKSFE